MCKSYGDSYFVLSPNIRYRTTITLGDSLSLYSQPSKFATCEHFAHILLGCNTAELKEILEVGTGRKGKGKEKRTSYYYKACIVMNEGEFVQSLLIVDYC